MKIEGGNRTKGIFKENISSAPLVSVITVVFNGAMHLEATILSVLNQTYENVEYVIVDGGSTDGTLEIIQNYEYAIDYWVSQADSGIYNAMNKAMLLANGSWIGVLNADDFYFPDSLSRCFNSRLPSSDYMYGSVLKIGGKLPPSISSAIPNLDSSNKIQQMPIPHVSMLINRDVFAKIGLYDESYRICADHEMVLRMINKGYRGVEIGYPPLAIVFRGGISSGAEIFYEQMKIAHKFGRSKKLAVFIYVLQYCNFLLNLVTKSNFSKLRNLLYKSRYNGICPNELYRQNMAHK
jgi:glycosyltransferase involved in cell wall biosynthesis